MSIAIYQLKYPIGPFTKPDPLDGPAITSAIDTIATFPSKLRDEAIASYAWYCKHHLAHITTLKDSKNWT